MYRVLDIIRGTTVDGPGFRTSIYFAGCSHHCPNCHNPQSWDPQGGVEMSLDDIMEIIQEEDFDVTLSGGDPLFQSTNLPILVDRIKNNRRNLWIYTGYIWEDVVASPLLFRAISKADVLIDGQFIEELKDPDLPFKGSSNQRIIDIQKSISQGEIILWNR